MNLIELRAQGLNRYALRDCIKNNIRSANSMRFYMPMREKLYYVTLDGGDRVNVDEAIRIVLKKHNGKKTWEAYTEARELSYMLCVKGFNNLYQAVHSRSNKMERDWQQCVWASCSWVDYKIQGLHGTHVSADDPTQVAYTPDVNKLLTDKQVRMKPGRYLMKFYGPGSENPVLSEADCKHWADRHYAATAPAELKVVPNTDPDGWEWVYENSPNSCMRYNRSARFLNQGLYGINHPVRAYAHPENDLALAYIMMPGEKEDRDKFCDRDEFTVGARTIINVKTKKWLRFYSNDNRETAKLRTLLEAEGYVEGNALHDQTLARREYDGSIICPYLDGQYTDFDDEGDYLYVSSNGNHNGQNSTGLCESNGHTCDLCGDRCDEDESTWIESEEQSVCQHCLDRYYVYAYVDRRDQEYVLARATYHVIGEHYTYDALEYHDIYECQHCNEYKHIDEMVTLEDGDTVCREHASQCEVTEEWHLNGDMVETEFDGLIAPSYAVKTLSGEWGYVDRCYVVRAYNSLGNFAPFYTHREDMEKPEAVALFRRVGEELVPASLGIGDVITAPFRPTNLTSGDDCDYDNSVVEDTWELLDPEDELVPFIGALPQLLTEEVRI